MVIIMKDFHKYEKNPVFGNVETGTTFDAYVWKDDGKYRMDFSWRTKKACAVTFSDDGINWGEPVITLEADKTTGWEDDINRNCVIKVNGVYKMWYTGQAKGRSYIGYAVSNDGINFIRVSETPVMIAEYNWEKESVMNPCVIYDNGIYKMWYSAGETYEPNVNAYATSKNGIDWEKERCNPIFVCNPHNEYEQNRVGGCHVVKTDDMGYVMFYIGYKDIDTAQICVAKSENGINNWIRSKMNPIIVPELGKWDSDACYKPTVVWNETEGKWMLWYNGRTNVCEYIGYAEYNKRNLFE